MCATQKQIEANRRNAKKSTGPRTPQGKAISSRNNTIHGLYSKAHVVKSPRLKEDSNQYAQLFSTLALRLTPTTVLQLALVRQIADGVWLQKRADSAVARLKDGTIPPARRLISDLLSNDRRTDRKMSRSFHLLKRLQCGAIDDPTAGDSDAPQPEPNAKSESKTNA